MRTFFMAAALGCLSSTFATAQSVRCEVVMLKRVDEAESTKIRSLPPDKMQAAVSGLARSLGTFEPKLGEEELTKRTFDLPGQKEKLFVGVYFTDEDLPGETTRLGMVVADKEPKDIFRDPNATSTFSNTFLTSSENPAPSLFLQRNMTFNGLPHALELRCTLKFDK